MGSIRRQAIQWTERLGLPVLVREINDRLRKIAHEATDTFRRSIGQLTFTAAANGTYLFFIADEDMEILAAYIRCGSGGGTVDVRINGVSVTPGSPYTFTTSTVRHEITGGNTMVAGDVVELVYATVTSSCVTSLTMRRLG